MIVYIFLALIVVELAYIIHILGTVPNSEFKRAHEQLAAGERDLVNPVYGDITQKQAQAVRALDENVVEICYKDGTHHSYRAEGHQDLIDIRNGKHLDLVIK